MDQTPNTAQSLHSDTQPLYYQWVMGKNRGEAMPLPVDKLQILLEQNIINDSQLSPQEQDALAIHDGQTPKPIETEAKTDQSIEDKLKAKAEAVHLIVDGLKIMLLEEFKKKHEVDWEQISDEEKETIAEKLLVENQGKGTKEVKVDFLMMSNKVVSQ